MPSNEFLDHLDSCPIAREHHAWVCSTARKLLRESCDRDGANDDWQAITRAIRGPLARTVVVFPHGFQSEFVAWAVGIDDGLVAVFTKEEFREQGIGASAIASVIPSPSGLIPCAIWTKSASLLAAGGFPIRFDLQFRNKFRRITR